MARPHKLLRDIMHQQEVTIEMLARELKIATCTTSLKMNAHSVWTVKEMWEIMDYLHIPANRLHEIFPRNGQNEPAVKRLVQRRAV